MSLTGGMNSIAIRHLTVVPLILPVEIHLTQRGGAEDLSNQNAGNIRPIKMQLVHNQADIVDDVVDDVADDVAVM